MRPLTVLAIGILLVACTAPRPAGGAEGGAPQEEAVIPTLEPAERVARQDRGYPGVVLARRSVEVAAELNGQLVALPVEVGDRVEIGAVLATIRTPEVREQLEAARASLRTLTAERRQGTIEVRRLRARQARREAAPEIFAREEIETLSADLDHAEAALDTLDARIDGLRAQVVRLEERLGRAVIRAPIDGIVATRYLEVGALPRAGERIVRVIDPSAYIVRFAVPPEHIGRLRVGLPLRFEAENFEATVAGIVSRIAPQIDPASATIFVEGDLRTPEATVPGLRAGLDGTVYTATTSPTKGDDEIPSSEPARRPLGS